MVTYKAAELRQLATPGRYRVDKGLYLFISKGGSKSWVLRIRLDGRQLDKGLGGFPLITMTEARRQAETLRASVANGRNPWGEKKAKRERRGQISLAPSIGIPTFAEAAYKHHADKVSAGVLGNGKHRRNWIKVLEKHAFPHFGATPIDEIGKGEVKEFLTELALRGGEYGKGLTGYRPENPIADAGDI